MLLDFSVKNFFSFKEGATLSFRLDEKCPESISNGKKYSTALCIKGNNASGKTQLIKAVAFFCEFVSQSFYYATDKPLSFDAFNRNAYPTDFEAVFVIKGEQYLYELSLTDEQVISETLTLTTKRKTPIFRREGDKFAYCQKKYDQLEGISLRKNVSVFSIAKQYGITLFDDIHEYFLMTYANVSYSGIKPDLFNVKSMAAFLYRNEAAFDFVKKFIHECDTGVSDIKLYEDKDSGESKEKKYFPIFFHRHDDGDIRTTEHSESSGTKRLFNIMGVIKIILDTGGLVLMDELDIHLHPHILAKVIDLFLSPDTNKNDAQLIFSTHNSEIMDKMGRYRTILVEKRNNESYAYRLDDIPSPVLRNDRPISPAYNAGKIGGVPDFEAAKELQ